MEEKVWVDEGLGNCTGSDELLEIGGKGREKEGLTELPSKLGAACRQDTEFPAGRLLAGGWTAFTLSELTVPVLCLSERG